MSIESLGVALFIALLRTVDVSLATVRISLIVQGRRIASALVGFLEALVFVIVTAIVLTELDDPIRMVGYAVGFAMGQYFGVMFTDWLRIGTTTVRIFLPMGPVGLADAIRDSGFAVTVFDGWGRDGPVRVVHAVVPRRALSEFMRGCKPWSDDCFVTIGDLPVDPGMFDESRKPPFSQRLPTWCLRLKIAQAAPEESPLSPYFGTVTPGAGRLRRRWF